MASEKKFEDLDLSQEEIKRISEALKDEKFRKMFVEYAEEISNPENRKRYEEEIAMMEQEKGMDVQFVHPTPGYVLKTVIDGEKKAFVNICTNDKIAQPTSRRDIDSTGKRGLNWQIPHSFAPPREEFDKNKKTCMVYDVVFHPDTYRMTTNPRFKDVVEDTALEGIERQFQCKVDRNNIKRPKLNYKGQPVATVIRTRKENGSGNKTESSTTDPLTGMHYPYSDKTSAELAEENLKNIEKKEKEMKNKESKTKLNVAKKEEENGYTIPKYSIVHRGFLELQDFTNARDSRPTTRPKEIVVSIELPLCKSAAGVDLDIFDEKLSLKSEKPAYKLDMKLPYPVDDENGSAKFDKTKKCLIVTLPVVPPEIPSTSIISDDTKDTDPQEIQNPPLIEELCRPEEVATVDDEDEELPPLEDIVEDENEHDSKLSHESKSVYEIAYNLPQYEYCQDSDTVTFTFHVRNVTEESVSKAFPKQGACLVKFISLGSGGFPMHYGFYADFGESSRLVAEHTTFDITEKNMTLTLLKGRDCRFNWNTFLAGLDDSTLEEKLFLTTDNLNLELDQLQLEGESMGQTDLIDETNDSDQGPHVEVTEMNKKKLTIKISDPKGCFTEEDTVEDDQPSSASIQIVHSKDTPDLHGILKQRSVSESSTDYSSGSMGESPTSTSPRDADCPKKVTFNSRVDRTTFKSNAATKTIKATLKNKRRHERKKEAKKEFRRRRHTSTGSEGSSCDDGEDVKHSSESHSDEDHEDLSDLIEEMGNKVEVSGVIAEEDDKVDEITKQSEESKHEKGETKQEKRKRKKNRKKNKLAEEVKNKMVELQTEEGQKCDSDDDDVDEDVESDAMTRKADEVPTTHKEVYRTSKSEVSEKLSNDLKVEECESVMMAANNGGQSGEPNTSGTSGDIKGDNPSICDQNLEEGYHEKVGKEQGNGDQLKNVVETELSWKDVDRESAYNEHKTDCAFKFSNAVMFDLDID